MVFRISALTSLLLLIALPVCARNPSKTKGVAKTTVSGLQYWDLKVGKGAEAKPGQQVKVNYTDWVTSGKKFKKLDTTLAGAPDVELEISSHDRIRPVTTYSDDLPVEFTLGPQQVMSKRWPAGVIGMKCGGKRQVRIPMTIADGAQGTGGGQVSSNTTLIFEIELLEVK
jgi:FKBP-type peptidyl-prolyl cis-trans isomerase